MSTTNKTPSIDPLDKPRHYRLTLMEKLVGACALVVSTLPGLLFALWMPSREVGAIFGTLWGTLLGALVVTVLFMRLHDRLTEAIRDLSRAHRHAALNAHPRPLPSYSITPDHRPHTARHTPLPAVRPTPPPVEPIVPPEAAPADRPPAQVSAPPTAPIAPIIIVDEEATHPEVLHTTERLNEFAEPASQSAEDTLNEVIRTTANLDVPGAVLMSMADLDAEITREGPTFGEERSGEHLVTRRLDTPPSMFAEFGGEFDHPGQEEHLSAHDARPTAQGHFANRATMPLDADVIQSFVSDQRSTQRIDDLPGLVSQELARRELDAEREERTVERPLIPSNALESID